MNHMFCVAEYNQQIYTVAAKLPLVSNNVGIGKPIF